MQRITAGERRSTPLGVLAGLLVGCAFIATGCHEAAHAPADDLRVSAAINEYAADRAAQIDATSARHDASDVQTLVAWSDPASAHRPKPAVLRHHADGFEHTFLAFATLRPQDAVPTSAPSASVTSQPGLRTATTQAAGKSAFTAPEGYWRQDLWHQMGHEALELGRHDFWHGFKVSYWNVPNALLLTGTMGASIAIRESDVDDAVRRRTRGQHELGDMDETIQILGNPATHFAATGVLWLGSTLMQDMREHEVAKALTQALAVNGMSTLLLKAAANTRTPDGEHFGWPSGHTSSAFTVAAVLNEYYGPLAGVPSFALAGLVGYQRIDSRVHDFSDVVFGAMMGYVIGTSIARDDKAQFPELFGMKVIPYVNPETGSSGLALYKQW